MTTSGEIGSSYDVEPTELQPQVVAVLRATVAPAGIPEFLGHAFAVVAELAGTCGAQLTGPPFARYVISADGFAISAGFPVDRELPPTDGVASEVLPGGPALRILHVGAYDGIGPAYEAGESWLIAHHKIPNGGPWESYLDDPEVKDPRTMVCMPYADKASHTDDADLAKVP